ncbi:precorrin-2 C20-methyltransferase/precorrin-3B C17-methyltransferase [Kribbella voronezhensis]|uniref:Precorrin-2 C20-methyltransferase/precorrin-3B C17-methyltransferase n=1 Tax=Kribbella voronezhensis TaxID=2512212 RepID=A0A4R7STS2_9ACTN|nr:precorrin-2 C(20)-methyltransferase [Kribbella voronezhensis]TDU82205.1 precorrin-2 C20-methyltransferase/precorrin-3B C17-methyltransferase [Kribbella voronezhensis]
MTGRLWGVGLGPGDPELMTVKAARLIGEADVIAFHSARHGRSIARSVAAPYLRDGQVEEHLVYPLTTETTDHPGGYQGAMDDFYAECAVRLAAHLDAGHDVVVLAEGDPLFYGSYMHMHKRLADRYECEVVPGVTSVSAAAAVLGRPLCERDEVLTVLPGTLPPDVLAERLRTTDAAAVMKLGRTFAGVREAFELAGRLDEAWYVERATTADQRTAPLADVDPDSVPYFSLALLPSPINNFVPATEAPRIDGEGSVTVVGLGPAGPQWMTPEVRSAIAAADDLIGYGPYVDRLPDRARQRKHGSDNQVESERAAFALDLARKGSRVVVVSSGDPGVFAMASAVAEVAAEPEYADVVLNVLPGMTAAQAVASRVGAPLGHDYCVLSLSDRLKPWEVIAARLTAAATADLAIAIYNPASKSRTWQVGATKDLLLQHRTPSTPIVIGRNVGGTGEAVTVTTLGELDPDQVDMRCLLLIGSSQTQTVQRPSGPLVFTPRRYPDGQSAG